MISHSFFGPFYDKYFDWFPDLVYLLFFSTLSGLAGFFTTIPGISLPVCITSVSLCYGGVQPDSRQDVMSEPAAQYGWEAII